MKTKVIFKKDKEGEEGRVFAFFPEMFYNIPLYGKDMRTCYAYLGQHSACLIGYAAECEEAKYNEYEGLLKELIGQGYKLEVLDKKGDFKAWIKAKDDGLRYYHKGRKVHRIRTFYVRISGGI